MCICLWLLELRVLKVLVGGDCRERMLVLAILNFNKVRIVIITFRLGLFLGLTYHFSLVSFFCAGRNQGFGPRLIVRSIKTIEKGEDVTISYTNLLQPKVFSVFQFITW